MHFVRNVLAQAGDSGRRVVAASIAIGAAMAACCHGMDHRLCTERCRSREPALRRLLAARASPIG